jgi:hypothetical protein
MPLTRRLGFLRDPLGLHLSRVAGIAHAEPAETSIGLVPLLQYMGEFVGEEELPRLLVVRLVV